jgi:isoaspartyl peptidase/L-asparaginase-like protein (Ntn-hydrolase superfamily)
MFALALHGGAGASRKLNYDRVRQHMRSVLEKARGELAAGASALDVAVSAVVELETSGLYVAGLGASPNTAGEYELDACVMDGPTRRAGSVASVRNIVNPILLARMVMERTPHVMLCGAGAESFARAQGVAFVDEPEVSFTRAGAGESNFAPASGTVGCVVRDYTGGLASATSTAGVFNKTPGRVGDSALIGCGGWADSHVAVSCTGQGEIFIRTAAAAQLAFRVRAGIAIGTAAGDVVADVQSLNGEGGLIAIDRDGNIAMSFNAEGMKRAWITSDGELGVEVFDR